MSADELPDPGLPQDPGIPGERAPRELPPEPDPEPLPGEDPGAVPEEPDQEGQRIVNPGASGPATALPSHVPGLTRALSGPAVAWRATSRV